eukprot:8344382-Pyramimonas_sp.AAC.1
MGNTGRRCILSCRPPQPVFSSAAGRRSRSRESMGGRPGAASWPYRELHRMLQRQGPDAYS